MNSYAVFDVETTGLFPARDRIVELAIVLVDERGDVIDEWETLINPKRHIGASEIHGLTGADLHSAPTFAELSSEVSSLFAHRIPVAHNLSFDSRFLAQEFARAGHPVHIRATDGLCTMRLAPLYLDTPSMDLATCSRSAGHQHGAAHTALADARAAAALLAHYLRKAPEFSSYWNTQIEDALRINWPVPPKSFARKVNRQVASATKQRHFIERLASRIPRTQMHPEANCYLDLLNRALLDRRISLHEQDELIAVALELGLSREDAHELHEQYLQSLCRNALEDGAVTDAEKQELHAVALALGLTQTDIDNGLKADLTCSVAMLRTVPDSFSLRKGSTIVFTGEAPGIERNELQYQAISLGLRVTASVSRKTAMLVSADPDSISGKAQKAREFGVPIVDYPAYFRMLDHVRQADA